MKNFTSLLIASFLTIGLFFTACNKGNVPDKSSKSYSHALMNGNEWKADGSSLRNYGNTNLLLLSFAKKKPVEYDNYFWWDQFGFSYVRNTLGRQQVWRNRFVSIGVKDTNFTYSSYYIPQADGDVGCDKYDVWDDDSANNWIEITRQEDDYKKIWGKYSVTFLRYATCAASTTSADTLRIRAGEFYVEQE